MRKRYLIVVLVLACGCVVYDSADILTDEEAAALEPGCGAPRSSAAGYPCKCSEDCEDPGAVCRSAQKVRSATGPVRMWVSACSVARPAPIATAWRSANACRSAPPVPALATNEAVPARVGRAC